MGLFGGSSKSSTTNQTAVYNTNLSGTEGVALANSAGAKISILDGGAIAKAFDFGSDALLENRMALQEGADLAQRGLDNAFNFGRTAVDAVRDVSTDSLTEGFDFGRDALTFVGDSASDLFGFTKELFGDIVKSNKDTVESSISGLSSLSKQTSQSSDDRVIKVAGYALLAIVGAFLLPAIMSKLK